MMPITAILQIEMQGRPAMAGKAQEKCFHEFDIERHPNPHLGFGVGKHFCLGASLARIETNVMFSELLRRADFRLAGPVRRLQSSFIHGIKELPVEATRLA